MNSALITAVSRFLQLIPILAVIIPLFESYWLKRNKINGLRRTRVILTFFLFSILLDNLYFAYLGIVAVLSGINSVVPDGNLLIADRTINLIAYWLLFYMFSHARKHNDTSFGKNEQI